MPESPYSFVTKALARCAEDTDFMEAMDALSEDEQSVARGNVKDTDASDDNFDGDFAFS